MARNEFFGISMGKLGLRPGIWLVYVGRYYTRLVRTWLFWRNFIPMYLIANISVKTYYWFRRVKICFPQVEKIELYEYLHTYLQSKSFFRKMFEKMKKEILAKQKNAFAEKRFRLHYTYYTIYLSILLNLDCCVCVYLFVCPDSNCITNLQWRQYERIYSWD